MRVAKVIGNIWATRKEDRLKGLKLLLVQSINPLDGSCDRVPFVAADIIGAGVGERCWSYTAALPAGLSAI